MWHNIKLSNTCEMEEPKGKERETGRRNNMKK